MKRDLHPLIVIAFEALSRRFGVAPEDMWAYVERRKKTPRWLVDALVVTCDPLLAEADFDIDETLPFVANAATIATGMEASTQEKIRGARPTKHPWTKALRKRKPPMSLAEWAEAHGVSYSTARSWAQGGGGGRAIPRSFQRIIEQEDGVPASAWKNGIVEGK